MSTKRTVLTGIAGAALAGGSLLALPGLASASVRPHTFATAKVQLETQLTNRSAQLGRLSADVTAAKSLTPAHVIALNADIASATANISALVTRVQSATTGAQLKVDRASMVKQNRVYAVLTPQVFETIEADQISSQVATFQLSEATLQSSVNLLVGLPGYTTAENHYVAFVRSVNQANENATDVATEVLLQTPADYPGDTHIFVKANKSLLAADIALAHATYDESVVGLASGGYTGS
ncbi:MAG TPA: hypothetical protein VIJ34_06315 [Acidimicrobiales bacterium]